MAEAVALALYLPLLAVAVVAVWRRPVLALYAFVVGLALHNVVLALLWGAGVGGPAITLVQGWKESLLAAAVASVALDALRARQLPFRPSWVDVLALAFALVVVVYALVPQDVLGGEADRGDIVYGVRHALAPVVAFLLGRSLVLGPRHLARLGWTIVAAAAAVAVLGLVDLYAFTVETWRDAGVPDYYRERLGFDYLGPGGMPENFAFNSGGDLHRRLISTFVSPLATAFMLAVALLFAAAGGPLRRRIALPATALCAVALLFTFSRSTILALVGGFVVLAWALRRAAPLAAAVVTLVAGVAFALSFTSVAPSTHFFPAELKEQERIAREKGDVPGDATAFNPGEPSLRSHLDSLREGVETAARHPQGYGPGNAGAVAARRGVELKAGESTYTELAVEFGVLGAALSVAWSLALLLALLRTAWSAAEPVVRWAGAALAASLATVLALGIQTDVLGVPWLAYVVWSLAGAACTLGPALAPLPRPGVRSEARPGRVGEPTASQVEPSDLSSA